MIRKLAVVGGSSNVSELFQALHQFDLPIEEVCLIGRRTERLDPVAAFCRRLCRELGLPTQVTQSVDLNEGLQNASFVVNQLKAGGWEQANHIMEALGFRGHSRTLGTAVTNLPVGLEVGRAVAAVCPDAWLLQFTNPCGIHAEALARHVPALKTISGCPVPNRQRQDIARLLGRDIDSFALGGVEINWVGFNHCAWINEVTLDGQNALDEVTARNAGAEKPMFRMDMAEAFGCLWAVDSPFLIEETPAAGNAGESRARAFQAKSDDAAAHGYCG